MEYDDILTIEEAAKYLRLDVDRLYNMSKERKIPCVDFNKQYKLGLKKGTEFRYSRQLLLEEIVNASITQQSDEE